MAEPRSIPQIIGALWQVHRGEEALLGLASQRTQEEGAKVAAAVERRHMAVRDAAAACTRRDDVLDARARSGQKDRQRRKPHQRAVATTSATGNSLLDLAHLPPRLQRSACRDADVDESRVARVVCTVHPLDEPVELVGVVPAAGPQERLSHAQGHASVVRPLSSKERKLAAAGDRR